MSRKYGWRPDVPSIHDRRFGLVLHDSDLPEMIDLRPCCPPVYDQLSLSSCTANAIAGALEFDRCKENKDDWVPSRLFIYYNERNIEGTTDYDAGASIRDGIESLRDDGYCAETEWPYDISKFTDTPSTKAYENAKCNVVTEYMRVEQTVNGIKTALELGFPVIFGFTVYESFESEDVSKDGVVPMPGHDEEMLGGHAVLCVGYESDTEMFIVRNSWGSAWGDHGYCYMPFSYLTDSNLADDFWAVKFA